jgi:hypothetical protein
VSRLSIPFFLSIHTFLCGQGAMAQEQMKFTLVETIAAESHFFTADPLGNIFWTNREGLTRYEPAGKTRKHYSNPSFGSIHFIDANDPLNVLIFHRDFHHIGWLDRNLAPKETMQAPASLMDELPSLVCNSGLGGFWVYLPQAARLQRLSQGFELQAQSLPLFEMLPDFDQPSFLIEADGRIFLSQPEKGIAVFDAFGNFLFVIEKRGLERFQVQGNRLIYFSDEELIIFDFVLQEETLFLLPETEIRSGLIRGRRVFVQTKNEIRIYQAAGRLF